MTYRLYKIFTTDTLLDAHVLQAVFESYEISAYLWEGNGVGMEPSKPLESMGIKVFIDAARKEEAEKIFRERFGAVTEPPYTGSLSVFGKAAVSQMILDPRGEETMAWDAGKFDPLAAIENEIPAETRKCPYCQAEIAADSERCDQCGERMR